MLVLQYTYSLFTITYYFPKIAGWILVKSEEVISKNPERWRIRDFWWGKVDSNHRRHCQQIYSLSPLATREFPHIKLRCQTRWSWWTDSNPRPADYKSAALPAELHQHGINDDAWWRFSSSLILAHESRFVNNLFPKFRNINIFYWFDRRKSSYKPAQVFIKPRENGLKSRFSAYRHLSCHISV